MAHKKATWATYRKPSPKWGAETGFSGHYKTLKDWGNRVRDVVIRCEMNMRGIEQYIKYRAESGREVSGYDLWCLEDAEVRLRKLKDRIDAILEKL